MPIASAPKLSAGHRATATDSGAAGFRHRRWLRVGPATSWGRRRMRRKPDVRCDCESNLFIHRLPGSSGRASFRCRALSHRRFMYTLRQARAGVVRCSSGTSSTRSWWAGGILRTAANLHPSHARQSSRAHPSSPTLDARETLRDKPFSEHMREAVRLGSPGGIRAASSDAISNA